ncbi:MAG: 23S rRNA (adenine(2503)-C(2))-methyltransferase RlmN [Deltaproteobacteria bacterium]|nr:23S rRNA (adenine(2503)-C(2))-methyltransferase RlmN [Deltaproteobacteria bacterium]
MKNKESLFDKSQQELEEFCISKEFKKYNARQIMRWVYFYQTFDFTKMTDISKSLIGELLNNFHTNLPEIAGATYEEDINGYSKKYLIRLADDMTIESVLINYNNRKTLCVSSQIGCKMGCAFCETAGLERGRNLSSGEIISQILLISKDIKEKITNVVFMGMGEPLDNMIELKKSLNIMSDNKFLAIAPRKITVSTCGLLDKLNDIEKFKCKIAISLNASDDITRSRLMPVNKKFPLKNIVNLINLQKPTVHNKITLEYVLIKGINDNISNAKELIKMFSPSKVKFNLIPLNKGEDSIFLKNLERPEGSVINDFKVKLLKAGFTVTTRFSKAQSINGGCGQLTAKTLYS